MRDSGSDGDEKTGQLSEVTVIQKSLEYHTIVKKLMLKNNRVKPDHKQ